MTTDFTDIVQQLSGILRSQKRTLVTAESCTGGLVAHVITSEAGSSEWFECGFVTYSNASKHDMLDIPESIANKFGAVSEEMARAMAEGALEKTKANVSLSITGIAGPTGGTTDKPVGTVWFAWTGEDFATEAHTQQFEGDRYEIQSQAAVFALAYLEQILTGEDEEDETTTNHTTNLET